jgi:lysophospholipase L1-like esterase
MKSDDPRFADIAANYYTEKYDFNFATGYTPDIVFIFLGTNDLSMGSNKGDAATFANTYKAFVEKIFEVYGKETKICILQALTTSSSSNLYDTSSMRHQGIERAVEMLTEEYPDNIHFINSSRIFTWGVDISSDGTHPSALGYETLTNQIANYLPKIYK